MKRLTTKDIGGNLVKDNDQYFLYDNTTLSNLVLSKTKLWANKSTNGHKHEGQEEIYFFVKGRGIMQVDTTLFDVKEGDIILIEDGVYHRVFNESDTFLEFICVFDGNRNH